jgi:phosphatidate cytidylyltransferase
MIRARLLTVAVGVPLLVGALAAGPVWWALLIAGVALVGVHEMVRLLGHMGLRVPEAWALPMGLVALGTLALPAMGVGGAWGRLAGGVGPVVSLAASFLAFLTASGERPFTDFLGLYAVSLYPAWLLGFLLLLRAQGFGVGPVLWLMLVVWLGDAAAYALGRLVGGWRPVPGISPGKTLSGYAAGLVASLAVAALGRDLVRLPLWSALGLGLGCALVAQFGDLSESLIKRRAGVKDSGALLPGHGGILDRFDGVLLAAPLLYYCLQLLHP